VPYEIKRAGKVVESHNTLADSTRAFWLLTAHELKNGRVADYTLDTKTCDSVQMLPRSSLPDWAADELAKHDLLRD
jgi:hypothetical protein